MNELTRLKLSIHNALIGTIPTSVYCVSISILDKHIKLTFYTETEFDEDFIEDISCIETEVIADFDTGYTICTSIIICKKNQLVINNEVVVFLQKIMNSGD